MDYSDDELDMDTGEQRDERDMTFEEFIDRYEKDVYHFTRKLDKDGYKKYIDLTKSTGDTRDMPLFENRLSESGRLMMRVIFVGIKTLFDEYMHKWDTAQTDLGANMIECNLKEQAGHLESKLDEMMAFFPPTDENKAMLNALKHVTQQYTERVQRLKSLKRWQLSKGCRVWPRRPNKAHWAVKTAQKYYESADPI